MTNLQSQSSKRVFDTVWQARAHAIALHLSEAGYFSWERWTASFGEELRQAKSGKNIDDNEEYYLAWQNTLERLLIDGSLVDKADLEVYRSAWALAFERTEHGQPVELIPSDFD